MFKVDSLDQLNHPRRGMVFVISSPVTAPRNAADYLSALGGEIEINGEVYKPLAFEWNMPGTPVSIGESVGILVEEK